MTAATSSKPTTDAPVQTWYRFFDGKPWRVTGRVAYKDSAGVTVLRTGATLSGDGRTVRFPKEPWSLFAELWSLQPEVEKP